jgi:hypothetical protein
LTDSQKGRHVLQSKKWNQVLGSVYCIGIKIAGIDINWSKVGQQWSHSQEVQPFSIAWKLRIIEPSTLF